MQGSNHNRNTRISIVVPVYNVKEYLDQCISSILAQTYPNIEVILVDDGSTDGSGEICKHYAGLDARVKLLSQKNCGLTMARKNGSRLVSGEYIAFVDADDYVDEDLYAKLASSAENFDLVISRWKREDGTNTRIAYDQIEVGAYQTKTEIDFILDHLINVSLPGGAITVQPGIAAFAWNKLYRTNIAMTVFEEIDETISFAEDRDFTYRYLLKCTSVLVSDICGYHYRVRAGSISRSADRGCKFIENACKLYNGLEPVFRSHPRCDSLMAQLQMKLCASLVQAPGRMGFEKENQLEFKTPVFPFFNLLDNKYVALYGGGALGQSYRRQILQTKACFLEVWVDKNWAYRRREGWDIYPAEDLKKETYDYIVVAAFGSEEAACITYELCELGISEEKILWREPLML